MTKEKLSMAPSVTSADKPAALKGDEKSVSDSIKLETLPMETTREVNVTYKLAMCLRTNLDITWAEIPGADDRIHITGPKDFSDVSDGESVEYSPLDEDYVQTEASQSDQAAAQDEEQYAVVGDSDQEEESSNDIQEYEEVANEDEQQSGTLIPCEFHLGYGPFSVNFRCTYDLASDTYSDLEHVSGDVDAEEIEVIGLETIRPGSAVREAKGSRIVWVKMDVALWGLRGTEFLCFKRSTHGEQPILNEEEAKALSAQTTLYYTTAWLDRPTMG